MEVSPPQLSVVQQELEEPMFAQEKPGLSSKAHTTAGLKVRKVSGTPVRSLEFKRNRVKEVSWPISAGTVWIALSFKYKLSKFAKFPMVEGTEVIWLLFKFNRVRYFLERWPQEGSI